MNGNIFQAVKDALHPRLDTVLPALLPGGKISGREYVCGSLQGGPGDSCKTNLDSGKGSDFATDESWGDVIGLWAKVRGIRQGEAARELAERYGVYLDDTPRTSKAVPSASPTAPVAPTEFTLIAPVPDNAPEPPRCHSQTLHLALLVSATDIAEMAVKKIVAAELEEALGQ